LRLFELGGIVFSSFSLRKATAHFMDTLQKKTRATVLLGVTMEEQLVSKEICEAISSDLGYPGK
jgi:IclR family transcriptional regulator, KDG regulon repressor